MAARVRDIEAARRNEQAAIDKMTKRQRLEALEDKTEALSSESDAVVARTRPNACGTLPQRPKRPARTETDRPDAVCR